MNIVESKITVMNSIMIAERIIFAKTVRNKRTMLI